MQFLHSTPSQSLFRNHSKITQLLPRYPLQIQHVSFSSKHHKNNTDSTTISNNAQFRSLPINKSILTYIESIGIGKKTKPKFKSGRRSRINKELNRKLDILEDQDEKMFFASTEQGTSRISRSKRQKIPPRNDSDGKLSRDSTPPWLPPAPFGNYSGMIFKLFHIILYFSTYDVYVLNYCIHIKYTFKTPTNSCAE